MYYTEMVARCYWLVNRVLPGEVAGLPNRPASIRAKFPPRNTRQEKPLGQTLRAPVLYKFRACH